MVREREVLFRGELWMIRSREVTSGAIFSFYSIRGTRVDATIELFRVIFSL